MFELRRPTGFVWLFMVALLLVPCMGLANADDEARAQTIYESARGNIARMGYQDALTQLQYLQRTFPDFTNLAGVKTRIAVLREEHKAGPELGTFLGALDARDDGDPDHRYPSIVEFN